MERNTSVLSQETGARKTFLSISIFSYNLDKEKKITHLGVFQYWKYNHGFRNDKKFKFSLNLKS